MKKQLLLILTALMLSLGATAQMVLQFDTNLSDGTTITLPLKGAVDVTVDWGDGTTDAYTTSGNQDHTYAAEGTYIVEISGSLTLFGNGMNAIPNIDKLIGVISFGDIGLTSLSGAFNGAKNLTQVPAILPSTVKSAIYMFYDCTSFNFDISGWDVSKIVNMAHMFNSATSFNQDIGSWDVGNVSDMYRLFYNATSFNQDISGWDVSKVTTMSKIFEGVTLSTANYNSLLIGWAAQTVKNKVHFGGGNNRYSPGAAADARTVLTDTYSWTISDGGQLPENAMVLEFNTNLSEGTTVTLPLKGTVDVTVDWGDGSSNTYTTEGNKNHTYTAEGYYTVEISGSLTQFGNTWNAYPNVDKLVRVTSFGNIGLTSLNGAFIQAINLIEVPDMLPSSVTSTFRMFKGAKSFNQDISGWDVSSVIEMGDMFEGATSFNQDIGSWNVSNVKYMNGMFKGVTLSTANYNSLLIGWAAQTVQNGVYFHGGNSQYSPGAAADARAVLTGAMNNWAITDGGQLSENAMVLEFNTNLSEGTTVTLPLKGTVDVTVDWGDGSSDSYTTAGNYDHTYGAEGTYTVSISGNLTQFGNGSAATSNIDKLVKVTSFGDIGLTSLSGAFKGATNLTQVPSSLPSTVTNTAYMFSGATAFNQDIGGWDVSKVTNMRSMFDEASAFNQNIGSWNVSNVTDMESMFYEASAFNQDIGNWDVGKVTSLFCMFCEASAFNQNIGSWNVSKVTDMFFMFKNATTFNQNLGGWDVSNVTDMEGMFEGVTLSTANYDNLLIGWAKKYVSYDVSFHGGNSTYSPGAAADARAKLIDTYSWTITDGGESTASAVNSTLAETMGVYPNPFQNTINISNASNAKRVVITNVVGKVVMVVDLNQVSNEVIETNVPSGMYLVTIFANDGSRVVRKMVRE